MEKWNLFVVLVLGKLVASFCCGCKTTLAGCSIFLLHWREEAESPVLLWHCCTFMLSTATHLSSHFIHPSKINVHLHISPHLDIISWQKGCVRIDAEQSWKIKLGLSQRAPIHKLIEENVSGRKWSVCVSVCDELANELICFSACWWRAFGCNWRWCLRFRSLIDHRGCSSAEVDPCSSSDASHVGV